MKKTMLLLFALMLSSAICAQDYHVVLWDNTTAPTSNGLSGDEVESKPGQWKNTQTAEMWIYKAGDNATGQALVFFPGGGYSSLSVGNGHKEAQWFARNGITAAVVKYRLPNGHSGGVGDFGRGLPRRERRDAFGREAGLHDPLLPGDLGRPGQTP